MRYGKSWGQLGMKYKLSEVMDVIGGGTPKTSKPEYWNGDIPWLSVKDFNNDYRYVYRTEKSITKEGLENSTTKLLDKGDMIISARGTVGEVASVPYPMAFNQSCYGLRAKSDSVVYEALQKACFMEVAKLYDKTRDAFSIGDFLETCKNNEKIFLECKEFIEYTCDGQDYKDEVPYQHILKEDEKIFFKDEVKYQSDIFRIFGMPESSNIYVNVTFHDLLDLYIKKINSLKKVTENIRMQRNKVYAHNDKIEMIDESIVDQNPITYPQIKQAIECVDNR